MLFDSLQTSAPPSPVISSIFISNMWTIGPVVFLSLARRAHAFPEFAFRIPNGYSVPNPGPQGGVWAGVGHVNAGGAGERNPFGDDFEVEGFEWTTTLCETDSDGDGRSNGVELGDPECEWVAGGTDPAEPALSHPGIVDEPQGSGVAGTCGNYVSPDDEISMDIAFSAPNLMNETQTHYLCEQKEIDVPAQQVLDQIKTAIILDNSEVLHHMFIYLCPEGAVSSDGDRVGQGQYECSGIEINCFSMAGWAIGQTESCTPENVGNRMDFSNSDKFIIKIEAHYDNTSGQPRQDQSGMRLHFTPTLRPLHGAKTILGMAISNRDFEIPPQQSGFALVNICPSAATENLEHPIFVYGFTPHMHLYGRQLFTEHYRCGKKIGEIGRIDKFEFDNQQMYTLARPIKILPGDALVTTCTFDTTKTKVAIDGGKSTTDEMCLNFLSMYPYAGTEANPNLFDICFSFEHGFLTEDRDLDIRLAVLDRNVQTVVRDFESDPLQTYASCCKTGTCEEMYLAEFGGACAVNTDCLNGLVCAGGLCEEPSPSVASMALSVASTTSVIMGLVSCLFV